MGLNPSETSGDQPADETDTEGADDSGPKVGVYLGDEGALEPWESWFGRSVDYYSFNVPTSGWDKYLVENMPFERPIRSIASEREIAVTMKLFPPSETTLNAVAAGEHADRHRAFARSLIDHGMADATLRIGHEMNGRWAFDNAVNRSNEFVRAWRAVVRAMDAADEAAFDYVWAPHIGRGHMDPTDAYPGDEWVDQIGLTIYDKSQQYYPAECGDACVREHREENWNRLVNQDFGLSYWAEFARDHEKSLAFPEYGVVAQNWNGAGGGDNPLFFERFADWIASNDDLVAWHNVWCFVAGPHFVGPSQLYVSDQWEIHSEASETFKNLFGSE
ncbi:glycosyl hydrolase [Halorubrum ejinorense]|uniref:Glycosyl hydrolase n=1 Tax=Halorubrum ejinorense TaxID=425309 RepID=A0AAV3SV04_9EURY